MHLLAFFLPVLVLADIQNCRIPGNYKQGWIANLYLTPIDYDVTNINFLFGLDSDTPTDTKYGVPTDELDFYFKNTNPQCDTSYFTPDKCDNPFKPYYIYGMGPINQEYFSLQMYGYFMPPSTDDYTFTLTAADDMALIRLGDGEAFSCCETINTGSTQYHMFGSNTPIAGIQDTLQATFFIPGGLAIPIKVSYAQRENRDASLNCQSGTCQNPCGFGLTITDSKGNDVSNEVVYLDNNNGPYCPPVPETTTNLWAGPLTQLTTLTSVETVTITTGTIVYTTSSVIVNIVPDTVTEVQTEVHSEVQTVTTTETVTNNIESCSAPDTLTVTESVTVTKSVTVDLGTDSVLTIYTSGTTEGTTTTLSCASDEL